MNLVEDINKATDHLEIQFYVKTDVGLVRVKNEDNFIVGPFLSSMSEWTVPTESFQLDEQGSVFIVADGMGGAVAGQIASTIAVESIKSSLINELDSKDSEVEVGQVLNNAIKAADKDIIKYADEHPECSGMGTTVTICYIRNNRLFISWIGDSRVYRYSVNGRITSNSYNEGFLEILTDDHSLVWNDVLNGTKSPEQARVADNSNVITQSLGDVFSTIKPDHRIYDLFEGDLILNCSDGLNSMLSDKEIQVIFKDNLDDAKIIAEELVTKSLEAGGKDNITIILMKVIKGPIFTFSDNQRTKEFTGRSNNSEPRSELVTSDKKQRKEKLIHTIMFLFALVAIINIAWLKRDSIGNLLTGKETPETNLKQGELEEGVKGILNEQNNQGGKSNKEKENKKSDKKTPVAKKPNRVEDISNIVDSDSDGVIDKEDDCPYEKGLISLNGCPVESNGIPKNQEANPTPNNIPTKSSGSSDLDVNGSQIKKDEKLDTSIVGANNGQHENKDGRIDSVSQTATDPKTETETSEEPGNEDPNSKVDSNNEDKPTIKEHPESVEFVNVLASTAEILQSDKITSALDKIELSSEARSLKGKIEVLNQSYTYQRGNSKELIREMKENRKRINKILKKYDLKV